MICRLRLSIDFKSWYLLGFQKASIWFGIRNCSQEVWMQTIMIESRIFLSWRCLSKNDWSKSSCISLNISYTIELTFPSFLYSFMSLICLKRGLSGIGLLKCYVTHGCLTTCSILYLMLWDTLSSPSIRLMHLSETLSPINSLILSLCMVFILSMYSSRCRRC